ncbi:MAG: F0F1 ATP synthase subunit A [Alphaproteobacteria bacterium]|nr:F0F1 ATP synthase subunit A [Alphaproteobacteria bacterium]
MIENFDTSLVFTLFGFGINATIFYTWIVMALLVGMSIFITRRLKSDKVSSKLQTIIEFLVMNIREQIMAVSGDNPSKYLTFIMTLFLFILTCNLLTFVPWFKPPTASLSTTSAFAFCVFLAIPVFSIQNAGLKGYLKKFIDPVPIMLPMNILGEFSSSFSLAFRLYGNIFSGVMIGMVLMSMVPFLLPISMQLLGLLTGAIQAYIFALLAIVYISSVRPETTYNEDKKLY